MNVKAFESFLYEENYNVERELEFGNMPESTEWKIANIYTDVKYQEILGFGAAVTESAAYNYSLLSDDMKKSFIEKHFSKKKGLGYNFGRTHINSCDFSLDIYSYIEEGDKELKTFNIERDKKYIIPFLKDIISACEEEIVLFASPWSPPAFFKENESVIKGGRLKEEYKRIWAKYFAKYIKAYKECNINISAVTVQNEPNASQTWESCYYSAEDERDFIKNHLIPVFNEEGLNDIKIIIWDHNKERVYDRAKTILADPVTNERVWAVGHHWYSGDHYNALSLVKERLNKPNICTEFCASMKNTDVLTLAEKYAKNMSENFNNYMIASCDWNILLSSLGGPYHNRTAESVSVDGQVYESKDGGCYAPVLYDKTEKKLIYTPIYYYIGHFSKFIKRGAKRLGVTKYSENFYFSAFCNPDGEIVAVALNPTESDMTVNLRLDGICTKTVLKAHSIATYIFS